MKQVFREGGAKITFCVNSLKYNFILLRIILLTEINVSLFLSCSNMYRISTLLIIIYSSQALGANILMATMGGTKSHKIPFWELAKGLISRCVLRIFRMH